MPVMSALEGAFCRSGLWRRFATRQVRPWALGGFVLRGDVLEIGGGSGAMAEGMAHAFPEARLTVTDVDDTMVAAAARRLRRHGNVRIERADVTALPYSADSFDAVTSFLMLHHVVQWSDALVEAHRVLRPSGIFVGFDLTDTALARLTHRLDGSPHRLIAPGELTDGLRLAGFTDIDVTVSARRHLMRFRAAKAR